MARPLTTRQARQMAAARKTKGGGRKPVIRPCEKCGVELTGREMLAHKCSR